MREQTNRWLAAMVAIVPLLVMPLEIQASPSLWGDLQAGPYAIGFRVLHEVDFARPIWPDQPADDHRSQAARPIQIALWYPAEVNDEQQRMKYRDYVALELSENGDAGSESVTTRDLAERFLSPSFLNSSVIAEVEALLNRVTAATSNADPAGGQFPVVLVYQGNGDPVYRQFVLCELLASHGYLVVSTPGISRIAASSFENEIAEQLADLDFALNRVARLPNSDVSKLSLIASSFGGGAVGRMMLRHPNIAAVVSLDSFLSRDVGLGLAKFEDSPNYSVGIQRPMPILNVYQEHPGMVVHDQSFVESFSNSERTIIRLDTLQHFNLTSLGSFAAELPELVGNSDLLVGGHAARIGHDSIGRLVLAFLETNIRGVGDFDSVLTSELETHPSGFSTVRTLTTGELQ